jgi:hypothetical protein
MTKPGMILIGIVGLILAVAVGMNSHLFNGIPAVSAAPDAPAGTAVSTEFTYQGRLQKGDQAFSGTCSMQFDLWDAAAGGAQLGQTLSADAVAVDGGLFTITLDFGDQFKGDQRWLETAVMCPGDGGYTTLQPRQALLAVPYALSLRPDSTISSVTGNGLRGIANAAGRGGLVGLHTGSGGYGVYGNSPNGGGVVGISENWTGVYGETQASKGTGAAGVYGKSKDVDGMAVAGNAEGGNSIGVKGYAPYYDSYGVWGETEFGTAGVFGLSKGENNIGVKGTANQQGSVGVWGESEQNTGVYGISRDWAGVWGKSTKASGIYGETTAEFGAGVFGENKGKGYGVKGVAVNGAGVWGKSTNWTGVYGETATAGVAAVWGRNTAIGGKAGRFDGLVEITNGADLAELFTVSGGDGVEPGTLLVIDPANPGELLPSSEAYDTRVAGIASGAGGVRPGLTLHQDGLLEGETEVAVAGRVYVRAEADSAPIMPGDLLTSSAVPGLAMKAVDRDRAYGAVIGKALSGLDEGQGLVLVLVGLQ